MIEIEKAISLIKERVKPIDENQDMNILNILNKVNAKDIYADIDYPPFNRSPYDGFLYKSLYEQSKMKVIETLFAGDEIGENIDCNYAIKIMTGANIPDGFDCIIKKEDVIDFGNHIILKKKINPYENYVFKGETFKKGDLLLPKGKIITSKDIHNLSNSGIESIKVYRQIKVGVLNTGNEIIELNNEIRSSKVYNSNKYILNSKLKNMDIVPVIMDIVKDDKDEIKEKISSVIEDVDILITTGGVSVGDKDYIKSVYEKLGVEILINKINIKPGGTCLIGRLDKKLICSLSGNPNSLSITFDVLITDIINYMLNKVNKCNLRAILKSEFNKVSNKDRYIEGYLYNEDVNLCVKTNIEDEDDIHRYTECLIKIPKNQKIEIDNIVSIIVRK